MIHVLETPSEKAMKFIRGGLSFRTPEIAKHLKLSQKDTDDLLSWMVEDGQLVTCTVIKDGRRVIEYRKIGVIF